MIQLVITYLVVAAAVAAALMKISGLFRKSANGCTGCVQPGKECALKALHK
jgi:hypothetical protein